MDTDSGSTSSWDYLDFELEIRGGGPREYPVAVRSPAGEAQGEMRFPYDEWELKDRLQSLEIALLRSGGTRRRIASPEEHTVQDFGRGLFESLLVGDVRTRYEMSLSEARRQGKGLRLKLRIQPSELAMLPWEFLYDAERDRYPSLSSNTPLVRYLDLPQPVEPLRVSPPLRVLGMVTSPLGLNPLDVEHEKRLVEEATRGLRERGLLELTWLEGQTWRHLQRAMRRGPWHIFHFVGHGGFDAATEEGALALSNDVGHMHLLRARSLSELLDDHYPLRLVFLNSCEGARGSENDAFSSTAATLVRRGVPAVVAMQYEITDRAAIEFSRDFYEALADNLPVDAAVSEARAAVSMDSLLEWGTPVLYMHSPDGRVFDILATSPRAHPTPEREERREEDPLRRYREGVESAWANEKLESNDVKWLRDLANNQLSLSPTTAADIEREVMGDTKEAMLERLERAAREQEHRKRLEALYTQARRSYSNQEWQTTLDVFEEIHAEDPTYPDPEGLLASARDALEAEERTQRVATLYDQGQRHIRVQEWQQALECIEEVQRLEPGYRDTEELMSRVRLELTAPPTVEVPDLSDQEVSQASSVLTSKGLKLGAKREGFSDTVPKGQIIRQSPEADKQVQTGTAVSVVISLGSVIAKIPDPAVKSRDEDKPIETRQAKSLSLGDQAFLEELLRVCIKYTGPGYYVDEVIPRQNLADARSRIAIPAEERVVALVDNSSMLSRGIGLAVCGDGIRWCNYAKNPVTPNVQGFLEWSEFADVTLKEHQWTAEYGIEMDRDNVFVAWKNNAMDQHRLVALLRDIQALVNSFINH
jgi:hypothetical protein